MTAYEIKKNYIEQKQSIFTGIFPTPIFLDFSNEKIDLPVVLSFKDCVFEKGFHLYGLVAKSTVSFYNCTFSGHTESAIKKLDILKLSIESCKFNNSISIEDSSAIDISIRNCETNGSEILLSKLNSLFVDIDWISEEPKANLHIDSIEINDLNIVSRGNVESITIGDIKNADIQGSYGKITISTKLCDSISIQSYYPDLANNPEEFYNSINNFDFTNQIFNGVLIVEELKINNFFLSNITSSGSINLLELQIKKAHFYDLNIKSFYWNQLDFLDFLTIERGDISNLKIANINWPKGKKMSHSFLDEKIPLLYLLRKKWMNKDSIYKPIEIIQLQYERETYRQLKTAAASIKNDIESLDFYKNEMRLYWKEIRLTGGVKWYDRILVFTNRFVSDFGQNWWVPLMWLFGIHFLLSLCLFYFRWEIQIDSRHQIGFLGEYFNTLNPIHKLPDYVNTDWGKVTDFVMRIFSSYFIYHFINASRKFGKS